MPSTLELNCLVLGEDSSHVFSVEILESKNISSLKEAIKDKKNNAFQHADADSLKLWKVGNSD